MGFALFASTRTRVRARVRGGGWNAVEAGRRGGWGGEQSARQYAAPSSGSDTRCNRKQNPGRAPSVCHRRSAEWQDRLGRMERMAAKRKGVVGCRTTGDSSQDIVQFVQLVALSRGRSRTHRKLQTVGRKELAPSAARAQAALGWGGGRTFEVDNKCHDRCCHRGHLQVVVLHTGARARCLLNSRFHFYKKIISIYYLMNHVL